MQPAEISQPTPTPLPNTPLRMLKRAKKATKAALKKLLHLKSPPKTEEPPQFLYTGPVEENTVIIGTNPKFSGENLIRYLDDSNNNTIQIGKNFKARDLKIVFKGNNNTLIIGNNVAWTGHILIVGDNRTVRIGSFTSARGAYIMCRDADISIGKRCLLSREIEIRSSDVHKIFDATTDEHLNPGKPVRIKDDVWIGARVMISKNTTIPQGSIVGAMSFVNKPFKEPNCVIAGQPAKVVKHNIRWER